MVRYYQMDPIAQFESNVAARIQDIMYERSHVACSHYKPDGKSYTYAWIGITLGVLIAHLARLTHLPLPH